MQILLMWLLQTFAHTTLALLPCYVQKFEALWQPGMEKEENRISLKFELSKINHLCNQVLQITCRYYQFQSKTIQIYTYWKDNSLEIETYSSW